MFALLIDRLILLFAEGGHAEGGFLKFYNDWLNIPGFEAWKFLNLAIFIAIAVYLLKKPLSDAFKARRDSIRAELIKAEEEKQAALVRLAEVEARLTSLESETASILEKARAEAAEDKQRLAEHTELEIKRLRDQVASEVTRLSQQTRSELRRFSAEESIRRAEEKIRSQIDSNRDSVLVKASIDVIGGLN
jgi:F0F1-type ATP synthase membrane subunit b/b'